MEDFMWKAGEKLAEMRIIIEGAVLLFDMPEERDTLETALYHLKDRISELQEAYRYCQELCAKTTASLMKLVRRKPDRPKACSA